MRREFRVAGFGGQGVILSGYIVGKAATLYGGQHAVLTQSYGPEARGGACSAEVVIDDTPVDYPLVSRPDCLVILSHEAYSRFRDSLAPGGFLLVDTAVAGSVLADEAARGTAALHGIPATEIAERLGRRIVANIVMLGFWTAVTGYVSRAAMEEAVRTSVPPKTVDLNLAAFRAGYEHAGVMEAAA
ncbi:MAG TPA: 2-oxoacid:acceptor oxidoreductase family protein [Chloroflexota bacterium]|nr:2-oxoacid:acceptor oxidoreductase family protein [Chloroflexota bacterium]